MNLIPLPVPIPTAWNSSTYQQTVMIVLSLIFIGGLVVYFLRAKNYYFVSAWASIKSWLVAAPVLFLLLGTPDPWPMLVLTVLAIMGAKIFFQIMGMFHRSYFVLICYAGIIGLFLCAWYGRTDLYNLMPMIVLAVSCLVPLIRNSYNKMIQYISITQLAFIFLGWSFMHLCLILRFEKGIYQVLYLIVLTEFCDNTNLSISRHVRGIKLFSRINSRRNLGSTLLSIFLTLILAGFMRFTLPDQSEIYWLTAGIVASLGGMIGDLVMAVVRRDAGVKIVGQFILGRSDILNRMDRLIFVAPIYYYVMKMLG